MFLLTLKIIDEKLILEINKFQQFFSLVLWLKHRKPAKQKINFFIFLLLLCNVCSRSAQALNDYADSSAAVYDESDEVVDTEATNIKHSPNSALPLPTFQNDTTTSQPSPSFEQTNANSDAEKNPSEVQKAVCTITAGEVRASAEAVTTKTLKGVCGSAELQLALANLESRIFKELHELKEILMLQQNGIKNEQNSNCNCNEMCMDRTTVPTITPKSTQIFEMHLKKSTQNVPSFNSVDMQHETDSSLNPKLKSLPSVKGNENYQNFSSSFREKEVSKFNNTMLADKDFKVFTYYWRLENFTQRIENDASTTLDSPRFSIKGKPLHLKAYFRHLRRDFLYLQLEYAAATSSSSMAKSSNSIMLDMGLLGGTNGRTLFKAISSNNQILFKYKIKILDQQNLRSSKDLISQEFHNLDGGFLVPNSALLASPYIKNNTLLVQLFLYL